MASAVETIFDQHAALAAELAGLHIKFAAATGAAERALNVGTLAAYEAACDEVRVLQGRIRRVEDEQAVVRGMLFNPTAA